MQSFLNHYSKLCRNSFARLPNLTETLLNLVFICYFRLKIQTTLTPSQQNMYTGCMHSGREDGWLLP